eukprot:jgi/Picre1/34410/NNA_001879.t1
MAWTCYFCRWNRSYPSEGASHPAIEASREYLSQLRSVLGLTNFYRRFCQGYAKNAAILSELLKGKTLVWSAQAQIAFETLKKLITQPFLIQCDASDLALGAVLMQNPTGKGWQPIEYLSHKFTDTEARYGICEKETLAIVYCLKQWAKFLTQSPQAIVETDNAAAARMLTQRELLKGRREVGYLQVLSQYRDGQLIIRHLPGAKNKVADPLSRLPNGVHQAQTLGPSSDVEPHHLLAVSEQPNDLADPIQFMCDTIRKSYSEDPWTSVLLRCVLEPQRAPYSQIKSAFLLEHHLS